MFVAPRALLAPIPALRQGAILVFCKVLSLVLSFSVDFSVAKFSVVKMCSNQLSIEKLENEVSGLRKGKMPAWKDILGCCQFKSCFSLAGTDNLTTTLYVHGRCQLGKC